VEIAICMAVVCLFVYTPEIFNYVSNSRWCWIASLFALIFVMVCTTSCCGNLPRVYPYNLLLCMNVAVFAGIFLGVMACLAVVPGQTGPIWVAFGSTCSGAFVETLSSNQLIYYNALCQLCCSWVSLRVRRGLTFLVLGLI